MFNGMMDPELFKLAQEQMSRMSPAELAKIQQQMMSNPDLLNMATESMNNMRPEELKYAAEQLKNVRPEDMADIGEKMVNASPEEIASMRARADAQMAYELNAAELLKKQERAELLDSSICLHMLFMSYISADVANGNQLHSQGKYQDAAQKYSLAKKNLKGVPLARGRALQLACSLNLMSCYLKTRQFHDCIAEGSEVLAYDGNNVKASYRRGQAFKELGQLQDAVSDLTKALENAPDDDTIAEVLSAAKESLGKDGITRSSTGLVIEEITKEIETVSSYKRTSPDFLVTHPDEKHSRLQDRGATFTGRRTSDSESLNALKNDPDMIRSFQNFMSSANPETLAKVGAGRTGEVPVDMLKTATDMISRMSPEELQNMIKMASSLQGNNPPLSGSTFDPNFGPGSGLPDLSPEMLKTAGDMMSKMPPEELQRMFGMASSLKHRDSVPSSLGSSSGRVKTESRSDFPQTQDATDRNNIMSEHSSSSSSFPNVGTTSQSGFPTAMSDMQEQMRNQMKDPAMRQMFSSMMKNMSPDMMANMSEQFGLKLSKEDAAKAQEAMASLSPEDLDKMMRWADRIQRGVEGAKKTKNWLLGRPGMILAICMLLLAIILHRFGFIGH